MLTNYMDMCVDQDIAVFIGGLALIYRCVAVLNVSQDQCTRTHIPSRVRIRLCDTQRWGTTEIFRSKESQNIARLFRVMKGAIVVLSEEKIIH